MKDLNASQLACQRGPNEGEPLIDADSALLCGGPDPRDDNHLVARVDEFVGLDPVVLIDGEDVSEGLADLRAAAQPRLYGLCVLLPSEIRGKEIGPNTEVSPTSDRGGPSPSRRSLATSPIRSTLSACPCPVTESSPIGRSLPTSFPQRLSGAFDGGAFFNFAGAPECGRENGGWRRRLVIATGRAGALPLRSGSDGQGLPRVPDDRQGSRTKKSRAQFARDGAHAPTRHRRSARHRSTPLQALCSPRNAINLAMLGFAA